MKPSRDVGHRRLRRLCAALPPSGSRSHPRLDRRARRSAHRGKGGAGSGRGHGHHRHRGGAQCPAARRCKPAGSARGVGGQRIPSLCRQADRHHCRRGHRRDACHQAADWQFACKAGTEAMQAAIGLVGSGMADYALAIGADTAQGRPGDALEYTAAPAVRPLSSGRGEESLAVPGRLVLLCDRHARLFPAALSALSRSTAGVSPASRPISSTSRPRAGS